MASSLVKKLAYEVHFCPTEDSGCVEAGWSPCGGHWHTLLSISSHLSYTTLQHRGRVSAGTNSALRKPQKINGHVN